MISTLVVMEFACDFMDLSGVDCRQLATFRGATRDLAIHAARKAGWSVDRTMDSCRCADHRGMHREHNPQLGGRSASV